MKTKVVIIQMMNCKASKQGFYLKHKRELLSGPWPTGKIAYEVSKEWM